MISSTPGKNGPPLQYDGNQDRIADKSSLEHRDIDTEHISAVPVFVLRVKLSDLFKNLGSSTCLGALHHHGLSPGDRGLGGGWTVLRHFRHRPLRERGHPSGVPTQPLGLLCPAAQHLRVPEGPDRCSGRASLPARALHTRQPEAGADTAISQLSRWIIMQTSCTQCDC